MTYCKRFDNSCYHHQYIAIAFQSLHNWENTFPYFEHGEHIFSENSLKRGAIARLPPWLWAWLPFNYFKIACLEFPRYLPYVFSLRKTLSERILLATSKDTVVCHCYAEKITFLPVRIEFSVFLWHFYLDTH